MKSLLYSTILIVCLSVSFISCVKKEHTIYKTRVKITDIALDNENYVVSALKGTDENGEHIILLRDARYKNGCPIPGDSAQIYYIEGENDTLRALRVMIL